MSTYNIPTIFNIKKENHPKLSQICSNGIFPREFKTAVVNEPSVLEPLKFYCKWRKEHGAVCFEY